MASNQKTIFGLFADASPDRWGRVLMNKRERILAGKEGRKPSKLYDVNPVPYGDELSLNVDEEDNSISIDLAVAVAIKFGISETDAKSYAKDILTTVRENWEKIATGYGLNRRQIEEMRPAFSVCNER